VLGFVIWTSVHKKFSKGETKVKSSDYRHSYHPWPRWILLFCVFNMLLPKQIDSGLILPQRECEKIVKRMGPHEYELTKTEYLGREYLLVNWQTILFQSPSVIPVTSVLPIGAIVRHF